MCLYAALCPACFAAYELVNMSSLYTACKCTLVVLVCKGQFARALASCILAYLVLMAEQGPGRCPPYAGVTCGT